MRASRPLDVAGHLTIASILTALLIGLIAPIAVAKPAPAPQITSISPDHGGRGATVTVTGRDFGGPKTRVSVGGVQAPILSSTGARATFTVPFTAPLGWTTVSVANPSGQVATVAFTVDSDDQIHPVLDTGRQSAAAIGPDGGAVSATGADGIRYDLQLPPGALDQEREITLAPVMSIANLPLSGGLRAAAHFEPSGLQLLVAGTLTITFPGTVPPGVAFAYGGEGDDFAVVRSTIGASTVVIPVAHFSGAGTGTPAAADFDALVAPFVGALGQLTYAQVRGLAALMIEWEKMFGADFCETRASCGGAMQRAHDSLVALAESACRTGHEDLSTSPALGAAVQAGRLLTDYEVTWDELREVDAALGAGSIAPDSLPISVAGQVSAPDCRAAILGRIIERATVLAESAPFATSDVGASPGADDESNISWLFELAGEASLLALDDLMNEALQAVESIVDGLLLGTPAAPTSGAVARAEVEPLEPAPAAGQEPIVIVRADVDGDAATSAWEWLLFLLTEAQLLGVEAGTSTASLETSLQRILDLGSTTCQTDEDAGHADLRRGRSYALRLNLLVSEFDDALAACGAGITISPTAASVQIGGQVQFTATVTGTPDTAVTWSSPDAADPVAGLFQAPLTPGTYHVVATITEHPSRTATAIVTVTGDVDVTVTPEFPGVLDLGDTVQFSATVTGGASNAVAWTATGGTISADGLFAATIIGLGSVTATSVEDPDRSATVIFEIDGTITVTVLPSGVTVPPGGTFQFSAIVNGTADQRVTWSASGGTIDATGLFTAGPTTGSRFYVLAVSRASIDNGDYIYGQAYFDIYPPFEVIVDSNSYTLLQAAARARDWAVSDPGSGDCDGSVGTYQQLSGLGSGSFACAASNGYGETSEAASSSSATVSSTGITMSGSASFALRYTAEGHASGLHPESRLEGFAEAEVVVRFQVTAPIGYALAVTSPESQNSCAWGMSDTNTQLVYGFNGLPLPATGTLFPGTTYLIVGLARAWDGAQEDTCEGSAGFDASLTFSPPAD